MTSPQMGSGKEAWYKKAIDALEGLPKRVLVSIVTLPDINTSMCEVLRLFHVTGQRFDGGGSDTSFEQKIDGVSTERAVTQGYGNVHFRNS
jgi:hypothetical protein